MTLDEKIRRGHEAERVMNEPLLVEAFKEVEAGLVQAMKLSKLGDEKTHHELVLMLQLHGRLRGCFLYHMQTGQLALADKETLAQRLKNKLRRVR